jgi:uncharacterized protein (DUF927 family)
MPIDNDDTNIAEMSGPSPEGPAIKDGVTYITSTFLAESAEGPVAIEVTVFKKTGGPLTKRIALRDGKIVNDSSVCFVTNGTAHRVKIDSVQALAELINGFSQSQAYALGRLKDGVLDGATVVVADAIKDEGDPSVIARTKNYLVFKEGEPGFVLLDVDIKGMPAAITRRMDECGGAWGVLCEVLPELKTVARVERTSTSSGLRNKETGETFPGSGGRHIVIPVLDAADIPRFLSDFHDRLRLTGLGWGIVSAAGAFLERSLVDKSCGSPERLIIEAAPIVVPPLEQEGRNAIAFDGGILDTQTACLPLNEREKGKLKKLTITERARLAPELAAARQAWAAGHIARMTACGMPEAEARAKVDRWIDWQELSGDFPLPFDDASLFGTTVTDVLAAPDGYINKALSDPFEGPAYGRGKAKLYRRTNGSLFIHSFAHGEINYELKADKAAGLALPRGFKMSDDGLWYRKQDEDAPPVKICGPFAVEARTSDDSHNSHGLLLKWTDRDGEQHIWSMPLRMVHAEGNAIAAELEDAGLACGTSRAAHELLKQFFGAVDIARRVRCVDRAGWHGPLYVLPNGRTFGVDADSIVLQTERAAADSTYAERGTLGEWRDKIACCAVGNDLLVLTISIAFAAPLLDVLGEPSGGVHIRGGSQIGKTTAARAAMSVYGPGDDNHMRTWRATANGLEAVAAETSDGLLVLDEISQANAREVDQVVYMLANNTGKARAGRAGGARRRFTWRLLFLSTGEVPPEAKLAEAGLRTRAGQDVRMVDLSADTGGGMGVWQSLHGFSSAAALAEHLRAAAGTDCGAAGSAYLDQLARERASDPVALSDTLRSIRQRFLDAHVPSCADGQVRSVAARFALIAAAGELATAYDITGWPEGEAPRAAGACFRRWLNARGGAGAGEDIRALEQVRAFIAAHGSSRFERVDSDAPDDQKIVNRAGFKRREGGEWEYLILPGTWRNEVCLGGLDPGRVAEVLMKRELLLGATVEHKADLVRITGHPKAMRLYRVSAAILGEETDGE